jgi:hypothetical protein
MSILRRILKLCLRQKAVASYTPVSLWNRQLSLQPARPYNHQFDRVLRALRPKFHCHKFFFRIAHNNNSNNNNNIY